MYFAGFQSIYIERPNYFWYICKKIFITEMLKKQITITESEIKWMVKECISKLVESAKIKRVGQYTAIDGSWWDGYPHGI